MRPATVIVASTVLSVVPMIGRGQQLDVAAAQQQFETYCAKCHGSEGRGDGDMGAILMQKPKDFTNCTEMAKKPDELLLSVIKNGGEPFQGQKSDMPAMRTSLSDDEIRALLVRVRQFCVRAAGPSVARRRASGLGE